LGSFSDCEWSHADCECWSISLATQRMTSIVPATVMEDAPGAGRPILKGTSRFLPPKPWAKLPPNADVGGEVNSTDRSDAAGREIS
jgi:hypothetical protein